MKIITKLSLYVMLCLFVIGISIGLRKNHQIDYDITYVTSSDVLTLYTYEMCLRNITNGEYEKISVNTDYQLINLFNENRNALPNDYYVDTYSNFNLLYYRNNKGSIDCIISNFDKDEEVFLKCFVNTLFYNGASNVKVNIDGKYYIYSELIDWGFLIYFLNINNYSFFLYNSKRVGG